MAQPRRDYPALGRAAILELIDQEHAVVWPEVEAKLADARWPTLPTGVKQIDPHHLSTARAHLLTTGVLSRSTATTRGGRPVTVYTPTNTHRRRRAIGDAAARKRLLETRYLGWASGSATMGPGVIGPAGEAVVHASMTAAGPYGYRLVAPTQGEVRSMYGAPVPGGPLDNAAYYSPVDAQGVPLGNFFDVLVEVKNIRAWIYPSTAELHQLLDKSARLQQAHPRRNILPVLVCRRAHFLTNQMAAHLGFYVISTKRQYVPASLAAPDSRLLLEVQNELGYDLDPSTGPNSAQVEHFTRTLPGVAERTAAAWQVTAQHLSDHFRSLRNDDLRPEDRRDIADQLATTAELIHGAPSRWH